METAIAALIIIAILLFAILTVSHRLLSAQDSITQTWREMEASALDRAHTDLTVLKAQTTPVLGNTVWITLQNDGETKLSDLDQWDVLLQYTGTDGLQHVEWYSYNVSWTVSITDVVDPQIFNPGEEMIVQVSPLSPAVASGSTNVATVVTPNGISATAVFTH